MNNRPSSLALRRSAVACALPLLAFVAQASAQSTTNFQGRCVWNSAHTAFSCDFDAQRPASAPSACPGSFIWKYQWDFGDGTSVLTGNPLTSHAFPNGDDRVVGLTVLCWNGQTPTRLRHVCVRFGTLGCLQVNGTWN